MRSLGRLKTVIISSLLLAIIALITLPSIGRTEEVKNVLILNSYHRGFTWSDKITEGIMRELARAPFRVNFSIEYLDWKNYPTQENIDIFYRNIKQKYLNKNFDLIITSDNAATDFVLKFRDELLPHTPLVFCGLYKDIAWRVYRENKNVTGVIENIDSEGTIRAALKLYPAAKQVYVIHERTESGMESLEAVKQALAAVDKTLPVKSWDQISFSDPATFPNNLPKDSILILTTLFRDTEGRTESAENVIRLLTQSLTTPIFNIYQMGLGYGIIGGSLLSPDLHGEKTAKLALRILQGESPSTIPPYQDSDRIMAFDYQQLKRFKLLPTLLPEGSILINAPISFYEKYQKLVWITFAIFVALLTFIATLLLNIWQRKKAEARIKQLAYVDSVTDLPNRTTFYEWLGHKLKQEKIRPGAIFFIDLDNFKTINDTFDHLFGDRFLKEVSRRLAVLQTEDTLVARIGGDEFIIATDSFSELDRTIDYAKKILSLFKETFFLDNKELVVSASIGIALYPSDGDNIDELLRKADSAMYKAKSLGKNNFALFDQSMAEELAAKVMLSHGLRNAITQNQLSVFYQPQINITNNRICCFEALARWISPEFGFVPPKKFISLAEELGLINTIGEWILRQACLFGVEVNKHRKERIAVSVNISSVQLMQTDFVESVQRVLLETNLDPNLLGLEITESILMEAFEVNDRKLQVLQKMGIKISLDDFGTGYSSLNYLRRLPMNVLKIDKTFIDDIIENEKVRYLISSLIEIAHNMGFEVVAEGVETEEQLILLREFKCDMIQGYLISKPVPKGELWAILNQDAAN